MKQSKLNLSTPLPHGENARTKKIEVTNRIAYDAIASEYNDRTRITTSNFHSLSKNFFTQTFLTVLDSSSVSLDLGCGTGFSLSMLPEDFGHLVCLDLSEAMLRQLNLPTHGVVSVVCGSAFSLPFAGRAFDLVVSGLASSFLVESALQEITRVLKPGGVFVFTCPTKVWSEAIRENGSDNLTTFVDSTGTNRVAYSFTYSNTEIEEMLRRSGFSQISIEDISGEQLESGHIISPSITLAAQRLNVPLNKLPVIQAVRACKI